MNLRFFLAFLLCCHASLQLRAAILQGVVSGPAGQSLVEGATVRLAGTDWRTLTDRSGRYSFNNLPQGNYRVEVDIIGYQTATLEANLDREILQLDVELTLNEDIVLLESFVVEGDLSSSLRALNLQRGADRNVSVLAADNFGQLTDNTVADAVRRLPGVNVEKDSQGRAGRYVTIRGMNSDFNSVTLNGQKVVVSNYDGASRSVPLDVIPSTSADLIEVVKAALPSDDADAIGGLVNIRTGSAFDHRGTSMNAEVRIGKISLTEDLTGNHPLDLFPYGFSAAWSDYLNEARTFGLYVNLAHHTNPYLYESLSNGLFNFDSVDEVYLPSIGRQEFAFDIVTSSSVTARLDFRPSEHYEGAFEFSYTRRDTNQGSWRNDLFLEYGVDWGNLQREGDTAVEFTAEDYAQRELRDYFETQDNYNAIWKNKHRLGEWTLSYYAGLNYGEFAGDPERDLRVFFRDTGELENSYSIRGRSAYEPLYGDRIHEDANQYFEIHEIRRDTRFIH